MRTIARRYESDRSYDTLERLVTQIKFGSGCARPYYHFRTAPVSALVAMAAYLAR